MIINHEVRKQLGEALEHARLKARNNCILKTSDLSRAQREQLTNAGFLSEIIRGWYLLTLPDQDGGTTAWYGGYWTFVSEYLMERFGDSGYCLAPESSINLISGDTRIPKQLMVLTTKGTNYATELPSNTSIFCRTTKIDLSKFQNKINNVKVMDVEYSVASLPQTYFQNSPESVEIALSLKSITSASITRALYDLNSPTSAERVVGALKYLGKEKTYNEVAENLKVAGFSIKDSNPFEKYTPQINKNTSQSPHSARIEIMWKTMREVIVKLTPQSLKISETDEHKKIQIIKDAYQVDAYNSLSIEGYQVTPELIAQIKSGDWNPELNKEQSKHLDALAAKGYSDAYETVILSIIKALRGLNPADILDRDIQTWYRALFSPYVQSGLFNPMDIAGYRHQPVYIKGSRHVPPRHEAVNSCMTTLFKLLKEEENNFVKAVLGHFIFVYIHPYSDGNGRMGRFILNLMLISGGFPWTIIKNKNRTEYMKSLEEASVNKNIEPFAKFIISEMKDSKESS